MVGGPYNFGYGSYMTKTFNITIPHYLIGIYVDFYKIDHWNYNSFFITIDFDYNNNYATSFTDYDDYLYVGNLCAGCYNEAFQDLYVTTLHTNSVATIEFNTDISSTQTKAYWGINNFQLSVYYCHPTCLTCSNGAINKCHSCYSNATKVYNNYCVCNLGYYMSAYTVPCITYPCSQCIPCDPSCSSCTGPTDFNCSSCNDGYYLNNSQCLTCNSNCQTCLTSDYCLSCVSPLFLINTATSWICETRCPYGYYPDTSMTCQPCDKSCATCNGPHYYQCTGCNSEYYLSYNECHSCSSLCNTCENRYNNCTSCFSGYYLYNNNCLLNCPIGYYSRVLGNMCLQCDSSCLTCTASDTSSCTSCASGEFLSSGYCLPCDPICKTCISTSINCKSCYTLFYYNNYCHAICPDGYWPRTTDYTCQLCASSCLTCTAGTAFDCLTCTIGKYLSNSKCNLCSSNCKLCFNASTYCLACANGKYLSNNTCSTICPSGYWANGANNMCMICDVSCKTCNNGFNSSCISCYDGYYLAFGNECKICSSGCNTCINSSLICTTCNAGTYLSSSYNCINLCPDGQYIDYVSNACKPCYSSCLTCKSPGDISSCLTCKIGVLNNGQCLFCSSSCKLCSYTSSNCTECFSSNYLYNYQCLKNCPDGYYKNDVDNICDPCHSSCFTCKGGLFTDCLSCQIGSFLDNFNCLTCYNTCLTCNGPNEYNCLTCQNTLYLQENSCVTVCKSGYYKSDTPIKMCLSCPNTCKSCISMDFNSCLTCNSNCYFTLMNDITQSGSCTYLSCPYGLIMNPDNFTCLKRCDQFGKYYNTQYNQCRSCVLPCLTCFGGDSNNCLSCTNSSGLYLLGNLCTNKCPLGYYPNNQTRKCELCSLNCLNCTSLFNCVLCAPSHYLNVLEKNCVNNSNAGQFINPLDKTIQQCAYGCLLCYQFPQCFQCKEQFYLNNEKICIEQKSILPILQKDLNLDNIFFLSFNDTWDNFFNNLTKNSSSYSISLENAPVDGYVCNWRYYQLSLSPAWQITIDFTKSSDQISKLIVDLNPIDEIPYNLTTTRVMTEIPAYIINTTNTTNSLAKPTIFYIDPSLTYYPDNLHLNLTFSDDFYDFFKILHNITHIHIDGIDDSLYNYTLINISNSREYTLSLINMSVSIITHPLLTIIFDIPGYIIYHPTQRLNRYNVSITLKDYYLIDSSSQEKIQMLENYTNILIYLISPLAFTHGVMNAGSMSYIGLEALNTIKLLRYCDMNYPPQALIIFKQNYADIKIFNNFKDYEESSDLPENLLKYDISSSFFKNADDQIIKLIVFLFLGIIFHGFSLYLKNFEGLIAKTIHKLADLLYFNIFLMLYFSFLMDMCLFSYINMKYYDFNSFFNIFSFLSSIAFIVITIILHFILYRIIIGKTLNKISPKFRNTKELSSFEDSSNNDLKDISIKSSKIKIPIDNLSAKRSIKRRIWWKDIDDIAIETPSSSKIAKSIYLNKPEDYETQYNDDRLFRSFPKLDKRAVYLNKPEEVITIKPSTVYLNKPDDDGEFSLGPSPMNKSISDKGDIMRTSLINKSILILTNDFQQISKTQSLYILFIMMRYILLPFITVVLSDKAYLLMGCYFGFNFMYLAYILCMQPFVSWWLFIENILIEGGTLFTITGALMQYISQDTGNLNFNDSMFNGWLIYYGNLCIIIVILSIYVCEIIITLFKIIWSFGFFTRRHNKIFTEKK